MRIEHHPILDSDELVEKVTIYFEGKPLTAEKGDTVAAVLTSYGIKDFRYTRKRQEPRGIYCAIGRCTDCMMTINGKPNVRSCMTPVEEGMKVERGHATTSKVVSI